MSTFNLDSVNQRVDALASQRQTEREGQQVIEDVRLAGADFLQAFPQAEEDFERILGLISNYSELHPELEAEYLPQLKSRLALADDAWKKLSTLMIHCYDPDEKSPSRGNLMSSGWHCALKNIKDQTVESCRQQFLGVDTNFPGSIEEYDEWYFEHGNASEDGNLMTFDAKTNSVLTWIEEQLETIHQTLDFLQVSADEIMSATRPRSEF